MCLRLGLSRGVFPESNIVRHPFNDRQGIADICMDSCL